MLRRFARFVVAYRRWMIALNVIAAGFFAWSASRLAFEMNPSIWFKPTDPAKVAYDKLHDYFGDDEFVLAVIEDKKNDVFSNQVLETVDRLTREMWDAPHINKVQSLTEFERIYGEEDSLIVEDLIDEEALPLSPEELDHAKEIVLNDDLAVNLLVNPEGTSTAIVGRVEHGDGSFEPKVELSKHLFKVFDEEEARSGYKIYYAGSPFIDYAFFTYSLEDNKILVPALYGLIVLVLFIVFRRITGVVYPVIVVALATLATMGLIVLTGSKLHTMTAMLPIMLVAICIAVSVHVVVIFYVKLRELKDRCRAAEETIVDLFKPCFLTSFTTAVGFGSLSTSEMPPVAQYGALAATGVMEAFIISFTFLPALLTYGRVPKDIAHPEQPHRKHPDESGYRDLTQRMLHKLDAFNRTHARKILFATAIVTLAAVYSATKISTETVAIEFFRGDSPIREYTYAIQDRLGGVSNIEIVVTGKENDAIKDPELLAQIRTLQDYLDTFPEIVKTLSLADFLERLNRSLHNEDPAWERLPKLDDFMKEGVGESEAREQAKNFVAQLLLLYTLQDPKEDLTDMVDYDYRHTRIMARTPFLGQERSVEIIQDVQRFIKENLPNLHAEPTGLLVLYNNMGYYVNNTLRVSFIMALLLITVTLGIAMRSPRSALMSMIPNIVPIIWVLGLMGLTGIALDVGTVMVAGITIGIAVDDTIHFLSRFVDYKRSGATTAEAIDQVLTHAGRAIVFTSVILAGGFWMLVFAQFLPTAYLGLLSGITIVFALVGDLIVLPALLYVWDPKIMGTKVEPGVHPAAAAG